MHNLLQLRPEDPPNHFPELDDALNEPNGLLAFGGDLSPERLIAAYSRGIFPWYSNGEPILWWSPDPRTVFIPGQTHVSRRLSRRIRKADFAITLDYAFEQVVLECSRPRANDAGTWLTSEMRDAYGRLHALGFAHSIEVWQLGQLVGGLYGVALDKAFFGESMFSLVTDMSKIALTLLSRQLALWEFKIFDAQVASPHLYRMGAVEVSRNHFQQLLNEAVTCSPEPGVWAYSKCLPSSVDHLPIHLTA